MAALDFLLDDELDLAITGGDIDFGDATQQHARDLLLATKGAFRQLPLVGVGITMELLNDKNPDALRRAIQQEMERDGAAVVRLVADSEYAIDLVTEYRNA